MTTEKGYGYYKAVQHNSEVDEYRKNDRERDHCCPVGMHLPDVPVDHMEAMDRHIADRDVAGWLMVIENNSLLRALLALSEDDRDFLHLYLVRGHSQEELAKRYGCSQQRISKRYRSIIKRLQEFMALVVKK